MSKKYWIIWGILTALAYYYLPLIGIIVGVCSIVVYPNIKNIMKK